MKVAIIGCRGKAGKYLIDAALSSNYEVRVLTRNKSSIEDYGSKVEVIEGNAGELNSIRKLLMGADAVINTVGAPYDAINFYSNVTANILKVMEEYGIMRYITVSAATVKMPGDKRNLVNKTLAFIMKKKFSTMIEDKQRELEIIKASKVNWSVFRLPLVADKDVVGEVKVSQFQTPGTRIYNRTLANFLVDQIGRDQYLHKYYFIAN